ncbi:MAG: hypothetical protein M9933_03095, partial [Chitinophagaceae bacterium]|nr:hypothetical protein [Chitinophagaceae bacterium]
VQNCFLFSRYNLFGNRNQGSVGPAWLCYVVGILSFFLSFVVNGLVKCGNSPGTEVEKSVSR